MIPISTQQPESPEVLPPTEFATAPTAVAVAPEHTDAVDAAPDEEVAHVEASIDEHAIDVSSEHASPAIATASIPSLSPAECAEQLKRLFPALFAGQAKPLKLRIQADIQQRAPGLFTKASLSAFLRRYTGSHGYLMALSKGTQRFDLDGAAAGELTAEHRQIAADELARRRNNQQSRRELEEQQRRNRAQLLHDFERTTLTPANFCALKGIAVDELDGYLATAREEAKLVVQPERQPDRGPRHAPERPPANSPDFNRQNRPQRPQHPDRPDRGGRPAPTSTSRPPRPR